MNTLTKYVKLKDDTVTIRFSHVSKLRMDVEQAVSTAGLSFGYYPDGNDSISDYPFNVDSLVAIYYLLESGFEIHEDSDDFSDYLNEITAIFKERDKFEPALVKTSDGLFVQNGSVALNNYVNGMIRDGLSDAAICLRMKLASVKFDMPRCTQLTDEVLNLPQNQFLINENVWDISEVIKTIHETNAFPLMVVLQESNKNILANLKSVVNQLSPYVSKEEMNVYFRVNLNKEFNEYVREEKLNTGIKRDTKVVFVGSHRLPTKLLESEWNPFAILYMSSHNFGTIGQLVSSYPVVFYYNTLLRSTMAGNPNNATV